MTHDYTISGMTCTGCKQKVAALLAKVPGVSDVDIDLAKGMAAITMDRHVAISALKGALSSSPQFQISEEDVRMPPDGAQQEQRSWWQTYKPVVLIFAFITGVSLIAAAQGYAFSGMRWMNFFMAGFFITFSFFKLLDAGGFADSYATYDIIARRWRGWGLMYAFIELALGIAYLTSFRPLITNSVALVVMSVSIVGVLQAVFNERKIRCACLGAVFNLPMSTITIIEDGLMIAMSAAVLISIIF